MVVPSVAPVSDGRRRRSMARLGIRSSQTKQKVASTFADWCKLITSIESALDVRDGLALLRTSAGAAVTVGGSFRNESFLARLLGDILLRLARTTRCSSSCLGANVSSQGTSIGLNGTWNVYPLQQLIVRVRTLFDRPCPTGCLRPMSNVSLFA